ncbi:hypothetical protein J6590_084026 [Homalodisca vitripennis]|nr:hypothetical protein J6590_084026 [Homalodisca vitripennis]
MFEFTITSCSKYLIELSRDNADFAAYGKCKSDIRFRCAGISKTTWKAKTAREKQGWKCEKCRSSKTRITGLGLGEEGSENPALLALKKLIVKMFGKQEKIITGQQGLIESWW